MSISAATPADIAEQMHDRALDQVEPVKPVDPVEAALADYKKFKELMPESVSDHGYFDGVFMLAMFEAYNKRDEGLIGKLMLKLFDDYVSE